MSILNITIGTAGADNMEPRICYIKTNNTVAEILATGFLNQSVQNGFQFRESDMCLVSTKETPSAQSTEVGWFEIEIASGDTSLVPTAAPGTVALPTVTNQLAYTTDTLGSLAASGATRLFNAGVLDAGLSGTAGTFRSYSSTAARGYFEVAATANTGNTAFVLTNAAQAAARTITIPDGGQTASNVIISNSATTQTIATGNLSVAAGNISAGASGAAGTLISFPSTAANGTLIISALNAGGAFNTTIRNSVMGQSSVVSIPDPGAATANFLLDAGSANLLATQEFVGISEVLTFGTGTWTVTRVAQGNYVSRHTPGDETSIIAIDVTPAIRVAASKGFRLDSFDVIYAIAANALDAHSATLNRVVYANNVAVSVTAVAATGVLATATQANPYVTNVAVDAPAFLITADSKYVIELTVDNAAASEYDYYGIMLRFSQTIG